MITIYIDPSYEMWRNKTILVECFQTLGFENLAKGLHTVECNQDIIDEYVTIAHTLSHLSIDNDVIDRLCFAGLING